MEGYLGERIATKKEIEKEYPNYKSKDFALLFIMKYGGIDGSHHKDWVMDKVVRILNGATVEVRIAEWKNGEKEFRLKVLDNSVKYNEWVLEYKDDDKYDYFGEDCIAP